MKIQHQTDRTGFYKPSQTTPGEVYELYTNGIIDNYLHMSCAPTEMLAADKVGRLFVNLTTARLRRFSDGSAANVYEFKHLPNAVLVTGGLVS